MEISDNTPKEQLAASTRGAKNAESVALTTDEVEKPRAGTNHEGPVEMPDKEYPFQLTTGRRLAFHNTSRTHHAGTRPAMSFFCLA